MPLSSATTDIAKSITRRLNLLLGATLLLYVVVVVAVGVSFATSQKTHDALCTFRGDLQARANQSEKFLGTHPGREPFPGISRETLKTSIDNQRRTIAALDGLGCD